MRVGILSDVHGNLPALDAALDVLREEGADMYLSAGDAIGYGPHPNECIDRLRQIDALSVVGNHELFLLDRLPPHGFSPRARQSLVWTRDVLDPERVRWLAGLPERESFGPIVMAHAALDGVAEYVVRPRQAARQLTLLEESFPAATILVLGHTHQPLFRAEGRRSRTMRRGGSRSLSGERVLINPGSVGQSRQWEKVPRARSGLIDLDRGTMRWFAIDYDHAAVASDLAAVGLPPDSVHLRPGARRALSRAIRTHSDLSSPRPSRTRSVS